MDDIEYLADIRARQLVSAWLVDDNARLHTLIEDCNADELRSAVGYLAGRLAVAMCREHGSQRVAAEDAAALQLISEHSFFMTQI